MMIHELLFALFLFTLLLALDSKKWRISFIAMLALWALVSDWYVPLWQFVQVAP